jgi:hypothetical protein
VQRNQMAAPAGGAPVIEPTPMTLTRWEQAEAEAEADLIDADLESCGVRTLRAVAVEPRGIVARATISDDELAEAESEADLSHVDHAA